MKRLHKLFERYFEEAKNLKNAYKSLPDELAIKMQQDLADFYAMESDLLKTQVKRECDTAKYYEDYKSSQITPADIKKPWYRRIFRKVKTYPNAPAQEIIARVNDEISIQSVSNMLTLDDEHENVADQSDGGAHGGESEAPERVADGANPSEAPAPGETSDDNQSKPETPAQNAETSDEPAPQSAKQRRQRRKKDTAPPADLPRLVEVQTPMGAQIQLEMPGQEQST